MRLAELVCWILVGALGCHHPQAAQVAADPGGGEVAVKIVSHNFADVVIYLDLNGTRSRLGMAPGERTTVFFIPWRRISSGGTIRLLADPVGDSRVLGSELLSVRPGSMVVWTLESPLSRSAAAVY